MRLIDVDLLLKNGRRMYHNNWYILKEDVDSAPTVDVAPVKHGRWLDGRCTCCGWEAPDGVRYDGYEEEAWEHTPYCPQCGAKMDLEGQK